MSESHFNHLLRKENTLRRVISTSRDMCRTQSRCLHSIDRPAVSRVCLTAATQKQLHNRYQWQKIAIRDLVTGFRIILSYLWTVPYCVNESKGCAWPVLVHLLNVSCPTGAHNHLCSLSEMQLCAITGFQSAPQHHCSIALTRASASLKLTSDCMKIKKTTTTTQKWLRS